MTNNIDPTTSGNVLDLADHIQSKSISKEKRRHTTPNFSPTGEVDCDAKLPKIERAASGYVPTTALDERILRQTVLRRAADVLPHHGIYLRGSALFDASTKREISLIPTHVYKYLFSQVRHLQAELVKTQVQPGKVKTSIEWVPHTEDLDGMEFVIENSDITRSIIKNHWIPTIAYENERDEYTASETVTPTVAANVSPEVRQEAEAVFRDWLDWMHAHAPDQLSFFETLLKEYVFSKRLFGRYTRRLNCGIGKNGSGKGSMIALLDCIPSLKPVHTFASSDCVEFRTLLVFGPHSSLHQCSEWKLDKQCDPGVQSDFKAALRGEHVNARMQGSKPVMVTPSCGFALFSNTNTDTRDAALTELYRYFADWQAVDRFNFCFIDWFFRYPGAEKFRDDWYKATAPQERRDALGLAVYEYAQTLRDKEIPFSGFHESAISEASTKARSWEEKELHGILFALSRAFAEIEASADPDGLQSLSAIQQREIAIKYLADRVPKNLRRALAAETFYPDAKGKIRSMLSATLMVEWVGKGNRKWKIPESMSSFVVKDRLETVRVVRFDPDKYANE